MWTVKDRVPVPPSYWDRSYTSWDRCNDARAEEAVALLEPTSSTTVLDLGAGPLMGLALKSVKRHVAVDFSLKALTLLKQLAPWVETVHQDVMTYVRSCGERFDVTLAMGILDYLPNGALQQLFVRCPSRELLVNTPICEGYVHQYDTRVCVYSRTDITKAAADAGWWRVRGYDQHEHEFALYRRLK